MDADPTDYSSHTAEAAPSPVAPPSGELTVVLRVATHPYGAFDPSEEDVPRITVHGTQVPAAKADAIIAKAAEHGVVVEKVDG